MNNQYPFAKMARVGFESQEERELYESHKIEINKAVSRLNSEAEKRAKKTYCVLCNKECSSFCNSHSVPRFVLRRIAENGKVHLTLQGEIPTAGDDTGINRAGTFHIICNDCDNNMFQEYESPDFYTNKPSDIMLAQIAMKNHLQMISKKSTDYELFELLKVESPINIDMYNEQQLICTRDLNEYCQRLKYARDTIALNLRNRYHLCYFQTLDYVVPFATQTLASLILDLKNNIINDVYNLDETYTVENIHIAIFPLVKTSVVIIFEESKR